MHPYLTQLCAAEHRRDLLGMAQRQHIGRIAQPGRRLRWPWRLRQGRRPCQALTLMELGPLPHAHTGSNLAASGRLSFQELAKGLTAAAQ